MGVQGVTGLQGITGIIGITGVVMQGATGIQGLTGLQGVTGIIGITGVVMQGATGIQGVTGLLGNTGANVQGATGTGGVTGIHGLTGLTSGECDIAALQIRRTTDYTITTSFVDITYDTTDIENLPSVIEHNNTSTDRIDIKENGFYLINYVFTIDSTVGGQVDAHVRKNDTTVLNGSLRIVVLETSSTENEDLGASFIAELANGDFLTQQIKKVAGTHTVKADLVLNVIKLDGCTGDTGIQGVTGLIGDTGITGNTGMGIQGITGLLGNTGIGSDDILSKSITVESPTATEDLNIFFTNLAITITEIRAVVRGSTPSVTWTVRHGTDRSAVGAEAVTGGTTTTSQMTGSDVTTYDLQ